MEIPAELMKGPNEREGHENYADNKADVEHGVRDPGSWVDVADALVVDTFCLAGDRWVELGLPVPVFVIVGCEDDPSIDPTSVYLPLVSIRVRVWDSDQVEDEVGQDDETKAEELTQQL